MIIPVDWKDDAVFDRQFNKLVDGLKLFYQKEEK